MVSGLQVVSGLMSRVKVKGLLVGLGFTIRVEDKGL